MHSLCIYLHSKSTGVPTLNFVNGSGSFTMNGNKDRLKIKQRL